VEVEEIEHDGVKYLKAVSTGIVYDMETSEEVGRWNDETKSIEVE
jgi:3-dehydroquinate synthetase